MKRTLQGVKKEWMDGLGVDGREDSSEVPTGV